MWRRILVGLLILLLATSTVGIQANPAAAAIGVGAGSSNPQTYVDAFNRIGGSARIGSAENNVHGWGIGCIQDFGGGTFTDAALMQRSCSGAAYSVVGGKWTYFARNGGQATFGYPTNDAHRWGAGWAQDFNYGSKGWNILMQSDTVGGVYDMWGQVLRLYVQLGGADGYLGYPRTDQYPWGNGTRQDFQGGSLLYVTGVGAQVYNPAQTREQKAVAWALAEIRSPNPAWSDELGEYWSGWCEAFVEIAYGTILQKGSAIQNYNEQRAAGRIHTDTNPPAGALVFYNTGRDGHVALSIGGGQIATTYGYPGDRYNVRTGPVTGLFPNYLGWSYAPSKWPGR